MINNQNYLNDLAKITKIGIPYQELTNKKIMITGACGLIGSYLVDLLMYYNEKYDTNIQIVATSRSEKSIKNRFNEYLNNHCFSYLIQDISEPINYDKPVDYIIHLASNADPASFKEDPVGTIKGNVFGLYYLLEYARLHNVSRVLYTSSGEVYGVADQNIKEFKEEYSGYVNPNNSRSCYPNSKRCAETLCASYTDEYHISTVIARPSHTYGPTMTNHDSRAYAEFIRNVLNDEDIVLKSLGKPIRSYTYVGDCVSALLYILLRGKDKESYNVANENSIVSIRELAETIAKVGHKKVVFDIPENNDTTNNNPMQCGILNTDKLKSLGWHGIYDITDGITTTINILKEVKNEK